MQKGGVEVRHNAVVKTSYVYLENCQDSQFSNAKANISQQIRGSETMARHLSGHERASLSC